jgi:hypothetical protein
MTRRRTFYFFIVPVLACAMPAMAGPSKPRPKPAPPRVVTITYASACGVIVAPSGPYGSFCTHEQDFTVHKNEKFASVVVTDSSGRPAAVAFHVTANGVSNEVPVLVCGSATRLAVSGGTDSAGTAYSANPVASVGDTGCPTPPTSGTIKITLFTK